MTDPIRSIHIAYGSESGNAQALAQDLHGQAFLQKYDLHLSDLNSLDLSALGADSLLLVITSSFGEGGPPSNADGFSDGLLALGSLPVRYCVFGLGDTSYPAFCGFSKSLAAALAEKQAQALIDPVEADLDYWAIYRQWLPLLQTALENPTGRPLTHRLSVTAYGRNTAYSAQVLSCERMAASEPEVYRLRLDLTGSGIAYQAGDLLYVNVSQPDALLDEYAAYFGSEEARTLLKHKELRLLDKTLLRGLAKICDNAELKNLLKISNKKALEQYIHGHDLLDVLRTFDPDKKITLAQLAEAAADINPRAYSAATCGRTHPDHIEICVRRIRYRLDGRDYQGTASSLLCGIAAGSRIEVFAKSNTNFHLPASGNAPIVMIGAGTGIAPFVGFLQNLTSAAPRPESYLFFGERREAADFLYREELQAYLEQGVLTGLYTAFSRDGAEKYYVQDALRAQGRLVWALIERGAYFYICGGKNMAKAVEETLIHISEEIGGRTGGNMFDNIVADLTGAGRLLKDVY